LNKAGERIVYAKLASYLKTMDASLDLTPIEEKEPEDAAGHDATHIPNTKQNTISLEPEKNAIGALPVINQAETDWELVMAFLVGKGLSVAGAAGVAGNIKIESNFNPAAVGDRGTSFGLAQWHKDRKDQLVAYAKSKDQHPGDAQLQLEYLWNTLVSSYSSLTNYLKSAKDPRDAAYQFAKQYERPATISNKRLDYAEQYAKEYDPSIIDRLADLGSNALSSLGAIATTALAAGAYSKYSNKAQVKTNSKNGQLSGSELKSIGNGHFLAPDAADAFLRMKAAALASKDKVNIKLSDSYRPLSVQHSIFDWDHYHKTGKRRKKGTSGVAAAYPGTSNHGLGRAIDVANAAAQDWIRANGEAYGWSWAEGRSVNEPWHFTYVK
jgi:LAS superfamily LD-carboxypeptidase LdcB